jgi:thiamine pyrophosphate-dependent acetolactate synthase large subunit-like protein
VTVREAALEVLRRHGLTTLFANPGSTEVPFLAGLPSDLRFVLGLHEGTVVGMATGWAIARGEPSVALLHTTAGLGNAVGALATARVNRAPLVVLVGQQDRRHLAFEPFLAGELDGLAGRYPVWSDQPARPADVPGAIARAWYEARDGRGPAIVIVPMDDWAADAADEPAAPRSVLRAGGVNGSAVDALAAMLESADAPVLVVGAGADDPAAWAGLVRLAERLSCPVWQEAFGARAGFPQDHPRFAGHLPAGRGALRTALAGHDLVLAVGAPVLRQYEYEPGRLVDGGTRVAVVTDDPDEAHRSPADLAVLASPAAVCAALAERVGERDGVLSPAGGAPAASPPADGEPLRAKHVLAALADRLPRDVVVVEETPSSRPDLHRLVRAREPLGFLSAAMGGLGFALPAAVGVRLARPDRPVVAVVGDGSSLYAIQALWSAARYRAGVLFVILSNGGYAIMDRLAGGRGPWPSFDDVDVAGLARALACPAVSLDAYDDVVAAFDEVVPGLPTREDPLVLDISVQP